MALKDRDRTRPRRLVRGGVIRLGHKEKKTKTRRDGTTYEVEYPVQDDHFLLHDAPQVEAYYVEHGTPVTEIRQLDVALPFQDVDSNFDAFYEVWAGGVLVCKGDGEYVQYAAPFLAEENSSGRMSVRNASGDTLINNGEALTKFKWNDAEFKSGDLVPCSGAAQDLYPQCRACKMSSILKVLMAKPELIRLAWYQLSTGSGRNYDTIKGTLEWVYNACHKVSGIRYHLRLVLEPTTYRENGQRHATEKWFLQIEPYPEDLQVIFEQQRRVALGIERVQGYLPSGEEVDAITGEILGIEDAEPEAPPPFAEAGGPAEEPAPESEVPTASDPLAAAKAYTTVSGKVLGDLTPDELQGMLEQINDLEKPAAKMQMLKRHIEAILDHVHGSRQEELPL